MIHANNMLMSQPVDMHETPFHAFNIRLRHPLFRLHRFQRDREMCLQILAFINYPHPATTDFQHFIAFSNQQIAYMNSV